MSNSKQDYVSNISGFIKENKIIILLLFFIILYDYDMYHNWYQKYSDSWFNYIAFVLQAFTIYEILSVVSERRKTQKMTTVLLEITNSLYTKYIPGDRYLNDVTDLIKKAKKNIYIVKSTLTPEFHTAHSKYLVYNDALNNKILEFHDAWKKLDNTMKITIKCLTSENKLQELKDHGIILNDSQIKTILEAWKMVNVNELHDAWKKLDTTMKITIKCLTRENMLQGLKHHSNKLNDSQIKKILGAWKEVNDNNYNNNNNYKNFTYENDKSEVPIQVWIIDRDEPEREAIFTIQKTQTSTDYGFSTKDPQLIEVLYNMTLKDDDSR